MAHQVGWLSAALNDVESIANYIAVDSPAYASAVVARILRETEWISTFPEAGRIVPEIGDERIRERIVYQYRVIYQVGEHEVLMLAVMHGARLLPENLTDRE